MQCLTASAIALTLTATSAFADDELVIYHWFEYIPQALLDKFSEETGIIIMNTYDSNESMLASLKAGVMGTYDWVVPADFMVDIMLLAAWASFNSDTAKEALVSGDVAVGQIAHGFAAR